MGTQLMLITYGNFNDDDIKEFKNGMLSCSQRISYKNRGASLIWQKLLFYDGTFFSSLNDGQDGICKCFVRTVCDNNGDPQSICTMTGVNGGSEQTEEGEFSVKEDSLPLIEIHTADVGNTNEAVRYTLEKFKCTFQFMTFNLFTTKNTTCLKSDQLTALNDKNIATCISIPIENTIQLDSNTEFEFGEILTKLTFSCKSYIEIFIQKETDATSTSPLCLMCYQISNRNCIVLLTRIDNEKEKKFIEPTEELRLSFSFSSSESFVDCPLETGNVINDNEITYNNEIEVTTMDTSTTEVQDFQEDSFESHTSQRDNCTDDLHFKILQNGSQKGKDLLIHKGYTFNTKMKRKTATI
ncbi:DgyrCDS14575 [Dimorphilus gyrociliatus]|uniref:DgyrCDS14575 n=1 Tax=Dimorphilus gyrociliatus TaxID=2664684 RepID=A0A7I8WEG1_9ANNE|nr:DgyrCDS14575 [Dimorphilus gyrociliatus]